MKKIVRNLDTPESRKWWASAERIAAQTKDWPAYKFAGIVDPADARVREVAHEHQPAVKL